MSYPEPDIVQNAVLVNGLPTVTFAPRPYKRVVRVVLCIAAVQTGVTIYRGLIAGPGITKAAFANPATYNVPFDLPTGQILYVVFDAAATPVAAASARISTSREDG